MKRLIIAIILILCQSALYSQLLENDFKPNKRIKLSEFVIDILSPDTIPLKISSVDFYDNIDLYTEALSNNNSKLTSDSLIIINREIILTDCRFESGVEFRKFFFKKEVRFQISGLLPGSYFEGEVAPLIISQCIFDKSLSLNLSGKPAFGLDLTNCTINSEFIMYQESGYSGVTIIKDNKFNLLPKRKRLRFNNNGVQVKLDNLQEAAFSIYTNDLAFVFENNSLHFKFYKDSEDIPSIKAIISSKAGSTQIIENSFSSNIDSINSIQGFPFLKRIEIRFDKEAKEFELINNDFQIPVVLNLGLYLDVLRLYDNRFTTIGFNPFKIPYEDNIILWKDISTSKIGIRTQNYGAFGSNLEFYTAETDEEVRNLLAFNELTKFYKKIYDSYRTAGDIRSSNKAFVKIKELETRRLKFEYKENPSFNAYFQLRLNQLLNIYTVFGTDPAKAMIISIWIIVAFAIFYFFFPSTWDVTSKSRLITDFKIFINKNEHGYIKPLYKLTGGFAISVLNAITLSLNAFVTLGFGEIPTKGIARYVTIIQGFLGWFLLSLFTVALLNQVVF